MICEELVKCHAVYTAHTPQVHTGGLAMISEAEALAKYPGSVSYKNGDSAELNAEILALVLSGVKTVSCDAVAGFEQRGEEKPAPGRIDIALDWGGVPVAAVKTVAVDLIPFDEMSEDLVADQGEFRDLAHWRLGYETYLARAGVFDPQVVMLVERFEVVEVFRAWVSKAQPRRPMF